MWKSSRIFTLLLSLLAPLMLPPVSAWAGAKQFTWYLDGVTVVQEVAVTNGTAEILLPPEIKPDSLRVKPLGSARLARVELVSVKPDRIAEKEITRLAERREELLDRLKALDVKEEIFKATAKSQGGKPHVEPGPILSRLRQSAREPISP